MMVREHSCASGDPNDFGKANKFSNNPPVWSSSSVSACSCRSTHLPLFRLVLAHSHTSLYLGLSLHIHTPPSPPLSRLVFPHSYMTNIHTFFFLSLPLLFSFPASLLFFLSLSHSLTLSFLLFSCPSSLLSCFSLPSLSPLSILPLPLSSSLPSPLVWGSVNQQSHAAHVRKLEGGIEGYQKTNTHSSLTSLR